MKRLTVALSALVLVSQTAHSEESRQLGAHVHGHATVNIAIEGTDVAIELETPGMDLVGFEHEATTPEQKAALAKVRTLLGAPLTLFKPPQEANCKVEKSDVELESGGAKVDQHDQEKHDGSHGADKAHDHHAAADAHSGHATFHAGYALTCASPSRLTSITFEYFKAFVRAQSVTVNIVTEKSQATYTVTRDQPLLDLAGHI